jgi:peptidyl-tRNA hydrolase
MTAKVWLDGDPEPNLWLPSGTDVTITRIDSGTVGVWSMGPGKKSWADLKVTRLELCE